jgi:hypothetical protein
MGLPLIFLILVFVKDHYLTLPGDLFLSPLGKNLRKLIDPLLQDWLILDMLWRAIPPWQPRPTLPTASL